MPKSDQGSVYFDQRKGRWIGIVDLGAGIDGKRRRQRVYGSSQREARRKLVQLVHSLEVGLPTPDGSMRFAAFFERWLTQTIEPNALSVNTADHYRRASLSLLDALLTDEYVAWSTPGWEGLLKRGVYHFHRRLGVDESVMWGDFFFLEAVDRALKSAHRAT